MSGVERAERHQRGGYVLVTGRRVERDHEPFECLLGLGGEVAAEQCARPRHRLRAPPRSAGPGGGAGSGTGASVGAVWQRISPAVAPGWRSASCSATNPPAE